MNAAPTRLRPRGRRSSSETPALASIAIIAALGGAASCAAPTGIVMWDAILAGGLAALISLAASQVQRQTLLIFSTISAALVGLSIWLAFGLAAVLFTIASVDLARRDRITGAVGGALAAQALLRWPPLWFFGLPSIIATAACMFLFWRTYQYSRRSTRKVIRQAAIGTASVVVIVLVAFAFALLTARADANRGVDAARRGLAAVRGGDTAAVQVELASAESALTTATGRLNEVWLEPVRLIPVAGQHKLALATASEQGAKVAGSARSAVDAADLSSLSLIGGQLDIGLLTQAAPKLRSTADSLVVAQATINASYSPWLVNPLQRRVANLLEELDQAVPEAQLSADAANVLPAIVGAETPQRYLVLVGNPGESRELGGFVGMYALVEFTQGRLHRVESGRINRLYERARQGTLDHPEGYPDLFEARFPAFWPQNLTGLNDIAEVHRAAKDVFPTLAGAPINGTIYLDPGAVAGLLELGGPVSIPQVEGAITAANAEDFLYRRQYALFPESAERFDALLALIDTTFAQLTAGQLAGPERIGEVLGPIARAGRLQVAVDDPAANAFLEDVFLLRRFEAPTNVDYLAIMQTNAASNKMDVYLQRNLRYTVALDDSGGLTGTVTAELVSTVPSDAPVYTLGRGTEADAPNPVRPGENLVAISLFTPHELTTVRINGEERLPVRHREADGWRYITRVVLPPNTTATVEWDLVGTRNFLTGYQLEVFNQPLRNDDELTVELQRPDGSVVSAQTTVTEDLVITQDAAVIFR